jgi:hypothetical protein
LKSGQKRNSLESISGTQGAIELVKFVRTIRIAVTLVFEGNTEAVKAVKFVISAFICCKGDTQLGWIAVQELFLLLFSLKKAHFYCVVAV